MTALQMNINGGLLPALDKIMLAGWRGRPDRGAQLRQGGAQPRLLLPARHPQGRHPPLPRPRRHRPAPRQGGPLRQSVSCLVCNLCHVCHVICSVMLPETGAGADTRHKTTVKWGSPDPEFNEQVGLVTSGSSVATMRV